LRGSSVMARGRSRRIAGPLCGFVFVAALVSCPSESTQDPAPPPPRRGLYYEPAESVASWLRSVAVETPEGTAWPVDALDPGTVTPFLGSGTAGVVLFFLEMGKASGESGYLADARRGADYLLATLPDSISPGDLEGIAATSSLYNGWAGVGFALHRAYEGLGDSRYRDGALACVNLLRRAARESEHGVFWNASSDIITGSAGTGLFLLYAANRLEDAGALETALRAADELEARAVRDSLGARWMMREGSETLLPNFSHGGAGVGFFFATLHGYARRASDLETALAAAAFLESVARTDGGAVFLVPYGWPDPAWEGRFDIGWAHGPVGTARLFQQLAFLTGDPRWTELVDACADGILAGGLPGDPGPGFGEEPFKRDRRFGTASVAEFCLRLYQDSGDEPRLALAKRLVDDLLEHAVTGDAGIHWERPAYEFMPRAGETTAYTGYFYGAAGYGLLLLQLDAATTVRDWTFTLPDNPFGLYSEFD